MKNERIRCDEMYKIETGLDTTSNTGRSRNQLLMRLTYKCSSILRLSLLPLLSVVVVVVVAVDVVDAIIVAARANVWLFDRRRPRRLCICYRVVISVNFCNPSGQPQPSTPI